MGEISIATRAGGGDEALVLVLCLLGCSSDPSMVPRAEPTPPPPRSIARLTEGSDVTRQAITKHLRVLEDVGLVQAKKHGRETMWTLEPERLDDARLYLDQISAQWDRALARLQKLVEE